MSKISLKHSGGNVVSLNAPTSAPTSADVAFKLPNQDGSANEVLKTDGSGNLSFGSGFNPSSLVVLEQFFLLCDGRSVSTSNGTVTTTNVTAAQALTDSFVAATGSSLTYQPPTGTTELIFEYKFLFDESNANDRYLFSYYLDIDGTAILESRGGAYTNNNTFNDYVYFKYGFRIGTGSDNATTGDRASWSSNKTISLKIARYNSAYATDLHRLRYYTPGASSAENIIRRPYVGITSIGSV